MSQYGFHWVVLEKLTLKRKHVYTIDFCLACIKNNVHMIYDLEFVRIYTNLDGPEGLRYKWMYT